MRDEIIAMGDTHVILAGDLNANPEDIPTMQDLLERVGWMDVGAQPRWAPDGPEPTCFAPGAGGGTRRDYIYLWTPTCGRRLRALK